MIPIKIFIRANNISMTAEQVRNNPNFKDFDNGTHWKIIIYNRRNKTQFTTYYSMGIAHNGKKPDIEGVLESLAMESSSAEYDFEEWCGEFGYDPYDWETGKYDENTLKTYKVIKKNAEGLERVLGHNVYKTLLYNVEF